MKVSRVLALTLLTVGAVCLFFASTRGAKANTAEGMGEKLPHGKVEVAVGERAEHGGGGEAEESPDLLGGAKERLITAIVTLIVFGVLVAVLGKTAWGPIAKGLQDREDKIRRDIEEAEAARARSEATLKDYQAQLATAEAKVRELLSKATTDAEQIAASIRTRAQQESQEIKENATKEIDSARRDAVRQVHEHAAILATNVAEKILKRNLNADDQRDLVRTSLEQLETIRA
jgi:F-type H+-transporting ATPase subunit b